MKVLLQLFNLCVRAYEPVTMLRVEAGANIRQQSGTNLTSDRLHYVHDKHTRDLSEQ